MLAIYILLQQTLICLFCSLFCSCSLWFCLFVSAACSSACWWQRGYRLMMMVALICLAEKYRANRMQHCRPEIGSSVDNMVLKSKISLILCLISLIEPLTFAIRIIRQSWREDTMRLCRLVENQRNIRVLKT